MTAYAMQEQAAPPTSAWTPQPAPPAPKPRARAAPPGALPAPEAGAGGGDPAMIAASLGMGDYLPARGSTPSAPAKAPAPAPAPGEAAEEDDAGGIPPEIRDRVGYEFDHDGGYRYRIVAGGGFEIIGAPGDQGVGVVITADGNLAGAWQTLCDHIVALGPVKSQPPKGGQPAPDAPPPPPPTKAPPTKAPKGGGGAGSEFLSQRDNQFDEEGCTKDNQCTPTSATMAILGRMSLAAFQKRAVELYAEQGVSRSLSSIKASQPEDVLVEWLYLYDPRGGMDVRISAANVIAAIEAWTGQDASDQTKGSIRETLQGVSLPGVVGTWLTGSGHTVELVEVNAQGIVINDPYGAQRGAQGSYLRHGESGEPPPQHRWSRRPDLASASPESDSRADWGKLNFYTWAEAEEFSIGKWAVGAK
jgi:hypothetical protein